MARLNMAKSRVQPAICSVVRIDQPCFGRRAGLAPKAVIRALSTRWFDLGGRSAIWSLSDGNREASEACPREPKRSEPTESANLSRCAAKSMKARSFSGSSLPPG